MKTYNRVSVRTPHPFLGSTHDIIVVAEGLHITCSHAHLRKSGEISVQEASASRIHVLTTEPNRVPTRLHQRTRLDR